MTRLLLLAVLCAAGMAFAPAARAQVPFFNQGAALFDPEISVVNSGVLNDVQATVSADRKYVTLNMRASNSELVALREFTFQSGNQAALPTGFPGLPGPGAGQIRGNNARRGNDPAGGAPARQQGADGPQAPPAAQQSVLNREGMTLVGRADAVARPRAGAP
jgi:hypothetical protein